MAVVVVQRAISQEQMGIWRNAAQQSASCSGKCGSSVAHFACSLAQAKGSGKVFSGIYIYIYIHICFDVSAL